MSTTANALLLPTPAGLVPLDLSEDTVLLPSFVSNDRTRPESIQSDYSPEFEVLGTSRNHALLRHAAASQPVQGQAYARLPAVLVSGGVEILPLGILLIKGYQGGRYQLQLLGGNRRLVEALGEKKLADLDLSRFDHNWAASPVLLGVPFAHWQQHGWGYSLYDRGKALDMQNLSPYDFYPNCAAWLVWQQILTDAGFTADSLLGEPLFAALDVPTANPYTFPQPYRDARRLQAGFTHVPNYNYGTRAGGILHEAGFPEEKLSFGYVAKAPFHAPDLGTASYVGGRYTVDALGYYDLAASVTLRFGCERVKPGKVRCKLRLKVNGQIVVDSQGNDGRDELDVGDYTTHTFTPKLNRVLLHPGDYVELFWAGGEITSAGISPSDPYWQIGPWGSQTTLQNGPVTYPGGIPGTGATLRLANEVSFTVTLREEFPQTGLVRLNEWLPDMKQLDFVKSIMLLFGLTIQCDDYEPHLHLAPGNKLLSPAHVAKAPDWTRKRDAAAASGRLPERSLAFRFGDYGQANELKWAEDEAVTAGYGDGSIAVADEVLPASYELATLPFAATLRSTVLGDLLEIRNFELEDLSANPVTYSKVTAKPRLVLREPGRELSGRVLAAPAIGNVPAVYLDFTTSLSYFASGGLSLELNSTVLGVYWADLRSMLDEARMVRERYRLTPADLLELDYSVPIWDGVLGDFYCVGAVSEYDSRRSVEVTMYRINAKYLPPPVVPSELREWFAGEFGDAGEWY